MHLSRFWVVLRDINLHIRCCTHVPVTMHRPLLYCATQSTSIHHLFEFSNCSSQHVQLFYAKGKRLSRVGKFSTSYNYCSCFIFRNAKTNVSRPKLLSLTAHEDYRGGDENAGFCEYQRQGRYVLLFALIDFFFLIVFFLEERMDAKTASALLQGKAHKLIMKPAFKQEAGIKVVRLFTSGKQDWKQQLFMKECFLPNLFQVSKRSVVNKCTVADALLQEVFHSLTADPRNVDLISVLSDPLCPLVGRNIPNYLLLLVGAEANGMVGRSIWEAYYQMTYQLFRKLKARKEK